MHEFENPDHRDQAAQHYEATAHSFTTLYAEAALERVSLTPASQVLDIAAGTGALALAAARTGARILATISHAAWSPASSRRLRPMSMLR